MTISFKQILLDRFEKKKLAHFYILETADFFSAENFLLKEVEDFLLEVLKKEGKKGTYESHPDFLVISPDEEKKEYSLEDFSTQDFFHFIEYRPYELSWRFILIKDAFKIGNLLSNKLLKTLEEPPQKTTILFLNPKGKPFLPTIQSRAITLRMNPPKSERVDFFSENMKTLLEEAEVKTDEEKELKEVLIDALKKDVDFYDFLEKLKSEDKATQSHYYNFLLNLERAHLKDFEKKAKVLSSIEWFETSRIFNNPSSERFYLLLNAIFNLKGPEYER